MRPLWLPAGEAWSLGIGRPAPAYRAKAGALPKRMSARRSRLYARASSSLLQQVPATRLVATCDVGTGTGDPASTFRPAVGLWSRPTVTLQLMRRRHTDHISL
jgi:hypothetical protein